MNKIKWGFLLVLVLSSMGCASVNADLLQNTIADNPNITPQQLQETLKTYPTLYNQIGPITYQVYNVGFFGGSKAVYFKDGKFLTEIPYDKYTNLKMLLQLGAISPDEYNRENTQFQNDDAEAAQEQQQQQSSIQDSSPASSPSSAPGAIVTSLGGGTLLSTPGSCIGNSCGCVGPVDCAGTCGGTATTDACGQCGGNGSECAPSS